MFRGQRISRISPQDSALLPTLFGLSPFECMNQYWVFHSRECMNPRLVFKTTFSSQWRAISFVVASNILRRGEHLCRGEQHLSHGEHHLCRGEQHLRRGEPVNGLSISFLFALMNNSLRHGECLRHGEQHLLRGKPETSLST